MSKTLQQVLTEQYPNLPQHEYSVVCINNNNEAVFASKAWPYDIYSVCPTQAQLDAWMGA